MKRLFCLLIGLLLFLMTSCVTSSKETHSDIDEIKTDNISSNEIIDVISEPPIELYDINSNNLKKYVNNDKYGIFDININSFITKANYDYIGDYSEGLVAVKKENIFFYLDENGIEKIELDSSVVFAHLFEDGIAKIDTDFSNIDFSFSQNENSIIKPSAPPENLFGYINMEGDYIITPFAEDIFLFSSDDLLLIKYQPYGNRWSDKGTMLIRRLDNGRQWGVVDKNGNYTIQPVYDQINRFEDEKALAYRDGLCGYINEYGEEISDFN